MLKSPLLLAVLLGALSLPAAEAGKTIASPEQKADATAEETKRCSGDWSGKWEDVWKYAGQGGDLSCSMTAGKGNELIAVFKAPGFLKDPVTVKLKLKAGGSTNGSVDMGKPAGILTFRIQLTVDKFTGEYDSLEERGKFELSREKK